jgi:membrane protein DedA with SNARE-associated domain
MDETGGTLAVSSAVRTGSSIRLGITLYGVTSVVLMILAGVVWLLVPGRILDPVSVIDASAIGVAIGIAVLASDAVAPVPSSAVMIALGATLGVGAATAVSAAGLVASALIGYGLGRCGARMGRVDPATVDKWSAQLLRRGGVVTVIATRPVPMLAETTAIVAGTVRMPLMSFVPAVLAGSLVPAFVYALVGAGLASWPQAPLIAVTTVAVVAVSLIARRSVRR